jgi:elongation factor Ts
MSLKITAAMVKELRDITGSGMSDCKAALVETEGNIEAAIAALRKKGQKVSDKRADREAKEGVVVAITTADGKKGIALNLACETDFVAKNEAFIELAKKFAGIALENYPSNIEELLQLPFEEITIGEKVAEQTGVIGEKIVISKYETLEAKLVVSYIHMGYKMGVLLALNQNNEAAAQAGKDAAMQVAAMNPIAVDANGVDASIIEREIEIGKEQARNEGKPEAMIEKIALGKLNKFYKERTLLNQEFVKDSKVDVKTYLNSASKGLTATAFKRVTLG